MTDIERIHNPYIQRMQFVCSQYHTQTFCMYMRYGNLKKKEVDLVLIVLLELGNAQTIDQKLHPSTHSCWVALKEPGGTSNINSIFICGHRKYQHLLFLLLFLLLFQASSIHFWTCRFYVISNQFLPTSSFTLSTQCFFGLPLLVFGSLGRQCITLIVHFWLFCLYFPYPYLS